MLDRAIDWLKRDASAWWPGRAWSDDETVDLDVLPNGMLHVVREVDGRLSRLHLRREPDGGGTLIVNASAVIRLSAAGVRAAEAVLRGVEPATAASGARGGATPDPAAAQAGDDIRRLLDRLSDPDARYPVYNMGDASFGSTPVSGDVGGRAGAPGRDRPGRRYLAPLEADVALGPPDVMARIVARLWAAGIPHVTFMAQGDAAPGDLLRAVERAEDTGMIAGVRALASTLAAGTLLDDLAQAGLDHVNVPYLSEAPGVHDALYGDGDHAAARRVIERARALELCPVIELPLVETTVPRLDETLAALAAAGLHEVECFAIAAPDAMSDGDRAGALVARALPQIAATIEHAADRWGIRFVWAPPVPRDPAQSLAAQVVAGPPCAGDVAMRVDADGTVVPPRGPHRACGNLLTDDWAAIWADPAFKAYREHIEWPQRCNACPGLVICSVGCPRDVATWAGGEG